MWKGKSWSEERWELRVILSSFSEREGKVKGDGTRVFVGQSQCDGCFWNSNCAWSLVFKGQLNETKTTLVKNKWWFRLRNDHNSTSALWRLSLGRGTMGMCKRLDGGPQSLLIETNLIHSFTLLPCTQHTLACIFMVNRKFMSVLELLQKLRWSSVWQRRSREGFVSFAFYRDDRVGGCSYLYGGVAKA